MRTVVKKTGILLLTVAGITFVSFLLMYLSPSDPARMMLEANGMIASETAVEGFRQQLGLDRPFLAQYLAWLFRLLQGDMGMSYKYNQPVMSILLDALPNTLAVTFGAMALTLMISIPVGVWCAVMKGRIFDCLVQQAVFILASFPNFFMALLLLYLIGMKYNLLPVIGTSSRLGMVFPVLTLTLGNVAWYIRQIRGIVLEELGKEYIRGLCSRGLSMRAVLFRHVLKNSMVPVVTMMGISVGNMLGGAVIVESIFTWPGIGKIAIDAVSMRDYPLIQGFVVWISLIYFLLNGSLEYLYRMLDPRIGRKKDQKR